MNRRNFIGISGAAFGALLLPILPAQAEQDCMRALEGVDAETNEANGFSHYHQLIIPVESLVNPPANGIILTTGRMDLGSYDQDGLAVFAKNRHIEIPALETHDHVVKISLAQLREIASGKKNVEIKIFERDGLTFAHNCLVTAPRSVLAIREKEGKK